VVFCTRNGTVKKTSMAAFKNVRQRGIKAIKLDENDELVETQITDGENQVIIATKNGLAVRFDEKEARTMGRDTAGVRGVRLGEGDCVVSMAVVKDGDMLLTVSENGYGKISQVDDYRMVHRGGKGVITIKTTQRNGSVVAVKKVSPEDELIVTSQSGKIIRIRVSDIRVTGRNAAGVRIMNLHDDDKVIALQPVQAQEEEPEIPADVPVDENPSATAEENTE